MSKSAALMPTAVLSHPTTTNNWWEKAYTPAATTVPQAHGKVMQTITFNLGSFDDEKRTFKAIASTVVTDRQGENIDQDGWELDNFKANPVIPWAHDYFSPPVARAIEVGVVNGVLQFTYQAPPAGMYEFADLIWNFYRNQYMFAFSVGFLPSEAEGNTFTKCELLEISAVVVPANPQALVLAYKSGDMDLRQAKLLMGKLQKTVANLEEVVALSAPKTEQDISAIGTTLQDKEATEKLMTLIEGAVEKVMTKQTETAVVETKGAISSDLPTADKGTAWDSGAAIKAVKAWASDSDGNIDFAKYKKAFMWVADGGGDKQGDYKLPFATVSDGKLVAVWNGVKAIMGVLNGARGGVQIPDEDRKSVYAQVKKYYKKFDEDVPDLKSLDDTEIEQKDAKGAVASEIADEHVLDEKEQRMRSVFEVFWAFCDVFYDEDTPADDFGKLLDETVSLLQKISAGTYKPGATDDEDEEDDDTPGVVTASIRGLDAPAAKLRFARFFVKLLTGKSLNVDNMTMGKKDMSESSSGGALTPTQMECLKAVNDYLKETKSLLEAHTDALTGHAKTMNAHADLLSSHAKGLDAHIKSVGAVLAGSGSDQKPNDPDGDGMNDDAHLDNQGGNNALDEQNYPDDKLTNSRSSGKSSEAAATKEAKGEVKSADEPTDGADQSDEEAEPAKDSEPAPVVEEEASEPQQPVEEASGEATLTEGKATDGGTEQKTVASKLTDETVVDPDNLSDEEAEAIVRAVNEALEQK